MGDSDYIPEILVNVDQLHALVYVDVVMLTLEGELFKKFLQLTKVMNGLHFSTVDGMLRIQLGVKDLWVDK